jgi:hypothetical protein
MSDNQPEIETTTLAETTNFIAWKAAEPDGEVTYHLELGMATLHFFEEEWQEFSELIRSLS